MKHKPWFMFDANAWLADTDLRRCSLRARGLLADLMALAHNTEPYGYIKIGTTPAEPDWIIELSLTVRAHHKEVEAAWKELCKRHRTLLDDGGVPYIKRMVQDHAYLLGQSDLGKLGGNPALKGGVKVDKEVDKDKEIDKDKEEETPVTPTPRNGLNLDGAVCVIPLRKKDGLYGVSQEQVDEWQEDFPHVDVDLTIREIKHWNINNPTQRKTRGGFPAHVTAWFTRIQNKG